jgi:RNA polymerase sigma-70 factor (ECF subfamily)
MRSHLSDSCKLAKKLEEDNLISLCIAGDQIAFSKLYKRYYGTIHSFCQRLLRGKFDVEDAVQHVFLEAWRSLKRFEGRSLFSTWLTKIAIHTCLSYHRSNKKVSFSVSLESGVTKYQILNESLWNNVVNSPLDEAISREKSILVNKLLTKMGNKKKVVFMLSDMQGMTAPEISAILKIPDATVRTRLFHARKEFMATVQKNKVYKEILCN